MPRPRPHRPAAALLAATAATALALPLLTSCDTVRNAVDCAHTAGAVVDGADKLRKAADHALDDPKETDRLLDGLDTDLKNLAASAHDPGLSKAIGRMKNGIAQARTALDHDQAPDLAPISRAAGEITTVCTPGGKE
ncbi:hypothetical protein ABT168_22925 [Streptomyces sp. NPDC001793]|uniref:hypothetical protein n=1 Tax=Streptomyces sp. NPDC001793 TaxID=3154657 RepID=UPI003326C7A5